MTQIQLIPGAAPPRPTPRSERVIDAVARSLLPEVIAWLKRDHDGDDERVISELKRALQNEDDWDGYKLTVALRDWECDRNMVEIMDNAEVHAGEPEAAELKAWIDAYDIRPIHAVGAAVRFTDADGSHDGEVVSIEKDRAMYLVCVPALGHVKPGSGAVGTVGFGLPYEVVSAREPS